VSVTIERVCPKRLLAIDVGVCSTACPWREHSTRIAASTGLQKAEGL
jgi:hypothetical protein